MLSDKQLRSEHDLKSMRVGRPNASVVSLLFCWPCAYLDKAPFDDSLPRYQLRESFGMQNGGARGWWLPRGEGEDLLIFIGFVWVGKGA